MATLPNFEINGVIDVGQSVMSNLNTMCTASGCWMTFDVNSGLWSVVLNVPGTSVYSFNDSNIIGGINVSGSGISELYNSVSVEFPHKDLRDQTDYVDMEIPAADWYPQETDQNLQMSLQCINNPIQAQYIGTVELKQSRVDRIIEFRTDYSVLGLKAGDIIDITATMYGFSNKKFRITRIIEEDSDDGNIQLAITALEYDSNVYDSSDLVFTERSVKTGIVPKAMNTALTGSDAAASGNELFFFKTGNIDLDETLNTTLDGQWFTPLATTYPHFDVYPTGYGMTVTTTGTYQLDYFINWGGLIPYFVGDDDWVVLPKHRKRVSIAVNKNGTIIPSTVTDSTTSTAYGEDLLTDQVTSCIFTAEAGDELIFYVNARSDYGPNNTEMIALANEVGYPTPINYDVCHSYLIITGTVKIKRDQ